MNNPYRAKKTYLIFSLMNLKKKSVPADMAIIFEDATIEQMVNIYGGRNIYIPTKKEWLRYKLLFDLIVELSSTHKKFKEFCSERKLDKFSEKWLKFRIGLLQEYVQQHKNKKHPFLIKNLNRVFKEVLKRDRLKIAKSF